MRHITCNQKLWIWDKNKKKLLIPFLISEDILGQKVMFSSRSDFFAPPWVLVRSFEYSLTEKWINRSLIYWFSCSTARKERLKWSHSFFSMYTTYAQGSAKGFSLQYVLWFKLWSTYSADVYALNYSTFTGTAGSRILSFVAHLS